jgi:hypothetical protein
MVRNQRLALVAILVVAILALSSFAAIIFLYEEPEEEPIAVDEIEFDDRISPFESQRLHVEILRIRNRGLTDRMMTTGTSWKNPPEFYWVSDVDGDIGDTYEIEAAGGVTGSGTFTLWDNMLKECRANYDIDEEQETSKVKLSIMEIQKTGLLGRNEVSVEKESFSVTYDYRTGHWYGKDDHLGDSDGYGHYVGEEYEIWFNIYQNDNDRDGIPFWTEVNIYGFDPTVSDKFADPDNDGIPSSWEWKYGYDPTTYDNHIQLDPDIDGIENTEEYMLAKYFSDPFAPDIYIEADGMKKGGLLDWEHYLFKESQQMVIEKLLEIGINVYFDDGWPDGPINGGGEMLDFVSELDEVVQGAMLRWYKHNFADERKGVFRYLIVANNAGFITPSEYNGYDHMVLDTSLRKTYLKRFAFTPRFQRVVLAKGVLHEIGHSIGLEPWVFYGIDSIPGGNFRWPESITDEEYQHYNVDYKSIMNYNYMFHAFDREKRYLFDFSDGSRGEYDFDDYAHIYLPSFQRDSEAVEEPMLDTFEDFNKVDKFPEPVYKTWVYHENLTNEFKEDLSIFKFDIDNAPEYEYRIYVPTECKDLKEDNIRFRVYVKPMIKPIMSRWILIEEGNLNTEEHELEFYSYDTLHAEVLEQIE